MTCRTVLVEKKNDSQPQDYVLAEERSDGCQNGLLEVQRVLATKRSLARVRSTSGFAFAFLPEIS